MSETLEDKINELLIENEIKAFAKVKKLNTLSRTSLWGDPEEHYRIQFINSTGYTVSYIRPIEDDYSIEEVVGDYLEHKRSL